jgi:predicted dehydrogenase
MPRTLLGLAILLALATTPGALRAQSTGAPPMPDVRFMTLDPGHFHASLVQKEMYAGVAPRVDVYAPLGQDLVDHLARVARFNQRKDKPTTWQVEVHTGPDYQERMLREKPGNALVLSGRNRGKIERIQASLEAGLHTLVDKPWVLVPADLPKLEKALATADQKGLVALDIMTERFEVTSELQRALVNDAAVFGKQLPGSAAEPAVYMESVHHLMKTVAGAPNIRPVWFFDAVQQGEGLNDIGTHLVDLVQWTLFPDQALDHQKDVRILEAQRWPTLIPRAEFKRVTREDIPAAYAAQVKNDALEYFCNTLVTYTLRGVHVTLNVIWDWEAPAGAGDTHFAYYRGSKSKVEVRQGVAEKYRTELYVVPNTPGDKAAVLAAVQQALAAAQKQFPGAAVVDRGSDLHVTIPDALRITHEDHFAQVAKRFLQYVRDRKTLPTWERPNMLAKYRVTTEGTVLAAQKPPQVAERRAPK